MRAETDITRSVAVAVPAVRRRSVRWTDVGAYLVMVVLFAFFAAPFLWLLEQSVNPVSSVSLTMPRHFSLENFTTIFRSGLATTPFVNSLILSLGTMALTVVVSALAAYPLSRYRIPWRRSFLLTILFMTGLPITSLIVPMYDLFVFLGLINTQIGVILVMSATSLPIGIWILRNFLETVPVELEEAAWVDGATPFVSFVRILLPLAAPGIGVVATLTFLGAWSNFYVPFILLETQGEMPATVTIYSFFSQYGNVLYGQLAAFSLLYSLPTVVLYFISRRSFGQSLTLGGVKG